MKNERVLTILLLFIMLCLLNCGGGFEEDSPGAKELSESILGLDSL